MYILCHIYYDEVRKKISVGGIETYITNLTDIANEMGYDVIIMQFSKSNYEIANGRNKIVGIDVSRFKTIRRKSKELYINCIKELNDKNDILLYATEQMAICKSKAKTISIQHGISWDIVKEGKATRLKNIIGTFRRFVLSIMLTDSVSKVDKVICVDYNYLNWYRTQIKSPEADFQVIPNFSTIPTFNESKHSDDDNIRIIFARRFQLYRGTRIFVSSLKKILKLYNNIDITIAGEGPDEMYMKKELNKFSNVHFTSYKSNESLLIHEDKDIAIIPTIGSEGTSLSLLEAMASQCAIICTNVGGMTNIIIDNYNGLMINPNEKELTEALKRLIENIELRKRLSKNAYTTVKEGFSHDLWESRWKKIISGLEDRNNG